MVAVHRDFPLLGLPFWGPHSKDCRNLGSTLGPLVLGKYHINADFGTMVPAESRLISSLCIGKRGCENRGAFPCTRDVRLTGACKRTSVLTTCQLTLTASIDLVCGPRSLHAL